MVSSGPQKDWGTAEWAASALGDLDILPFLFEHGARAQRTCVAQD